MHTIHIDLLTGASSSVDTQHTWTTDVHEQLEEVRDLLEDTFQDSDQFLVMVHVPGLAPLSIMASRFWRAAQLADAISDALGSPVDVHWPGLIPRRADALLHVIVETHTLITDNQTLVLIDGAGISKGGPRFKARVTPKTLTLEKTFALSEMPSPTAFSLLR